MSTYYKVADKNIGCILSAQEEAKHVKVSKSFVYKILAKLELLRRLKDRDIIRGVQLRAVPRAISENLVLSVSQLSTEILRVV